ncbi:urease accessory protein UreH domain-containing protein [Chlorobium ferrooxidans]|nr:sulfite exporter TauE/SafE family protein [Chlorobium ferrooxidans]
MKHRTYTVKGMYCPACKEIIEETLLESGKVSEAEASMAKGTVSVSYNGDDISARELNALFSNGAYTFSDTPAQKNSVDELLKAAAIALIVTGFVSTLSYSGLHSIPAIDRASSLATLFLFGLLAGLSSCAALVSGVLLSLTSQWMSKYKEDASLLHKMEPHLFFNIGRIATYTLFGALLGLVGETIHLSPAFTSFMIVTISLLMIVPALQMLGITFFNRFSIALPKKARPSKAANRKSTPLQAAGAGVMTILVPCGFTMAAEGAAVLSGSASAGMLIMLFFVLGTTLPLFIIGFSSTKLGSNPRTSRLYMKTAGMLIILFSLYNMNDRFDLTGRFSLAGSSGAGTSESVAVAAVTNQREQSAADGNAALVKTIYTNAEDITPSTFQVKTGQKVRMVVDSRDTGTGCMSTIMIPGLYEKPQSLVKGKPVIMEFTAKKPGSYKITCAMGVPRGVINVQ